MDIDSRCMREEAGEAGAFRAAAVGHQRGRPRRTERTGVNETKTGGAARACVSTEDMLRDAVKRRALFLFACNTKAASTVSFYT